MSLHLEGHALSKSMELLVFAHRGEAQTFIKELKSKAIDENTYKFDKGIIYICGEGIYDVLAALGNIINSNNIKQIINYGIAGALETSLELNKVYEIRTVYLEQEKEIAFKSYTLNSSAKMDCITSFKRVLTNEHAAILRPLADIVDRELWSITKVAKLYKITINSYKLISDIAGSATDCFDLKNRANILSQILYQHYIKSEIIKTDYVEPKELPFEATQYQMNQFNKLIKNIDQHKYENILKAISKKDLRDKEKTTLLLTEIKKILYPFKYKIINQLENKLLPLREAGISIKYDENLEKEKLQLQIDVNSQKNIEDIKTALDKFNYDDFLNIFKGDLDV